VTGQACAETRGKGWSILSSFRLEDEPHLTFGDALPKGVDFIGTFKQEQPKLTLVEAYSGIIENEDAGKTYRIVALIDVTEREKTQREELRASSATRTCCSRSCSIGSRTTCSSSPP
jgi:hypothetical protein